MMLDENLIKELRDEFGKEFSILIESFNLVFPELSLPETRSEAITKIFRIVHTIKSGSSAVGIDGVATTAHVLEDCLSLLRVYPERYRKEFQQLLEECMDILNQCVQDPNKSPDNFTNKLEDYHKQMASNQFRGTDTPVTPAAPKEAAPTHSDFRLFFAKAKKVASELTEKLEKPLDLFCFGETLHAPADLIRTLSDPLLHLIRNAVDHGLESPAERKSARKQERNRLMLKVTLSKTDGNQTLVIAMADDGRGMDLKKIIEKAIGHKLIPNETAAALLPENEILNLICHPGFSTAEKVTDVSGRGVGMDIVKSTVERLGGNLSITSKLGKGSTFVLKIPL
jgi:chemotaxis protein histidine kinase CheA